MDSSKPSLRELFADAAEIADASARAAFLDTTLQGDPALRERVERLLAADADAGKFLRLSGDTTTSVPFLEKPGDRIGRYRLIERIGMGGNGVVYLAEQEEPVRRRVALKVLKVGMDTQAVVARFEAERQALAIMDHPNIARVLDAGATETGRPFFVMELVPGQRLTDYCQARGLSLQKRLELFIPVCQAVQHAHQKGIIHRDLKPSNILVSEHEGVPVPKVIDFGIAKATEQGLDAAAGLTKVDQFLGTPAYMSPEQMDLKGCDIDTRTDIYSLGVILYELIAGQPPFDLATAGLEQMRRLVREVDPPRPSTRITQNLTKARATPLEPAREQLAAVRSDLDWVVMKCLEKDRDRRYETSNALAMDLRRHLEHEPVIARPPSNLYRLQKVVRRHRLVFSATATVALILLSAVIVSVQLTLRARRAEREQGRLRNVAEASASESKQRLIRRYVGEGNRLLEQQRPALALPWLVEALALERGDLQREADERLRIAQGLAGAPALLVHLAQGNSVNCVALNTDGSRLAMGSDDGVVRVCDVASGGTKGTNLSLPGSIGRLQFSPDGSRLVAMDMAGRARVWNAATGEPLTQLLRADDYQDHAWAADDDRRPTRPSASFSPDGKLVLLAWGSKSAQLRDAANGGLLREFAHPQIVYHAAFSPDGQYVITSGEDGTARVWNVSDGTAAGPTLPHAGAVIWSQFSPDGNEVLTVREHHFVQLWDWRQGRRLAPEIPRRSILSFAAFNQDGSRVLTTARSGYAQLYDSATSQSVYSLDFQGSLLDAEFSPVGRLVAYACHDGNVWVRDGDDPSSDPVVLPEGNQIQEISFSRDGRRLAIGTRGGHARVWELSPPWPGDRRLPGRNVEWVQCDHSGHRVLLLSTGNRGQVSVYDPRNCKLISAGELPRGRFRSAAFSPDGQRVLALGMNSVLVFGTESGRQLYPALTCKERLLDALWSPDGKFILTAGASGTQLWDAASGKVAFTCPLTKAVVAIAISPDGSRIATAQEDNSMQFWEPHQNRRIGGAWSALGKINGLRFSPDARRLAIATAHGDEALIQIRDVASGEVVGRPLVHRDAIGGFDFSPDSRWLATACEDHTARVWDAATGEPVTGWLPQPFEGHQVVFSPDGTRLATRARRGAVRLWNARTGEPITPLLSYPRNSGGEGFVCWSPDGGQLVVARGGDEAWLRDLNPEPRSLEELRLQAEVLSCTRFDSAAGPLPLDEAGLNDAWRQFQSMHSAVSH